MALSRDLLAPLDTFERRHTGSAPADVAEMLRTVGFESVDALADAAVPAQIRLKRPLRLPAALGEREALAELRTLASKNKVFRSFIGMGYYDTATPGVIQRNILENPGWYTAYTPYQAEISQGRLDALGGEQAWNGAHDLNQHFIDWLRATGPKEAADDLGLFLLPGPELMPPSGPAMVTSLLPEIANVPTILQVLEDFTRQLFWSLYLRHTAGANGSA